MMEQRIAVCVSHMHVRYNFGIALLAYRLPERNMYYFGCTLAQKT